MSGTIRPDTIAVSSCSSSSGAGIDVTPPKLNTTAASVHNKKPSVTAPRIDVEPLYTALKGAMNEMLWATYKGALTRFLTGHLNQQELTAIIDPILSTPALEHAHNSFVAAIYGNTFRDPPEPGVASWVSANDKPTSTTKPAGDLQEKRLKHEVMQLSRRERKRLKMIKEEPYDPFTELMAEMHRAKTVRAPDVGPVSAGGYQKTNWALEITKRYQQPLFEETHEFPDAESISARMVPICYEEGLPGGAQPDCAQLLNLATEVYIKEALTTFFAHVSSNGPSYVKTAAYRRQVEREEAKVARGEIVKSASGLLPVELEALKTRPPLCMQDVKLALELGDPYLGQVPLISGQIANGRYFDGDGDDSGYGEGDEELNQSPLRGLAAVNGLTPSKTASAQKKATNPPVTNGYHVNLNGAGPGDPMDVDEPQWSWHGGTKEDSAALDSVLEQCLALGS